MADPLVPGCGCEDCEAAVSPGAYLATLLDYAIKHVRNAGAKIDLLFLEARFRQPFSRLPIDCEFTAEQVSQVRLAVEVLRQYVGARPLFEAQREAKLARAEADYRLAAYSQLLTQIGSNYAEIRQARGNGAADRAALAERLGVPLTPPAAGYPRHDELDQLFLDPAVPAADPLAITERALERLFGLADTARERLSEGAKYGDPKHQFTRWNVDGAAWDKNTDPAGLVHLDLFKLDATTYGVRVFSDAARTKLVAGGERNSPTGPIRLHPENSSGLSGVVDIDYQADEIGASISVVPLLQVWRQRYLRALWLSEDAASAAAGAAPVIDPQLIGLDDLVSAKAGDAAYDVWLARTKWLDNQRASLDATRAAAATPLAGFEAMVTQALSTPGHAVSTADLDNLDAAQRQGQRIADPLAALGLNAAGFAFLLSIRGMARGGQPIVDVEWATVDDTLLFARKQLEFHSWRAEEQGLALSLSPQYFKSSDEAPARASSPSLPLWLSTAAARRSWKEILDARIAQQATVASELDSAVSKVEAAVLPLIRQALIDASDAVGDSLTARADRLAQQLLIDLRMSGTERTTRLAQAIETLQELLFGLRSGQLEQDTLLQFAPLESIFAVPQGATRINLFGRGSDDTLWSRVWDGEWRNWISLGPLPGAAVGVRPSNPVAAAYPDGRLEVIVRGSDRVLWRKRYDQGWQDWVRVSDDLELVGNLSIDARAPGQIEVFALRIGDLRVMQRKTDGATWTTWQDTGASSTRMPASASPAADRVDLILSRNGADLFKPSHRWWDGAAWQDEPLDSVLFSDPVAASWGANRLDVFQNFAGHLWQKTWTGAWAAWVDLDGGLPPGGAQLSAPSAVYTIAADSLEVFALRGSDVWRRHFAAGAWSDWEALPAAHLTLDAPDFDAEWEWIGSYSTYRAATFVRLYPESLLLPSLVTHQTPAFATLVDQSRPTKHLAPDDACRLAQTYSSYLRDVSFLDVRATCQALTRIDRNTPCKTAAPMQKNLCYMFARTKWGKAYWSAWDPDDQSGYAQSFWDAVPAGKDADSVKVMEIFGAVPWIDRDNGQHHIYVFVDVDELGQRKLKRLRFDVDRFGREPWDTDAADLTPLPPWTHPNGTVNTSVVNHVTVRPVQSDSVTNPPRLSLHLYSTSGLLYVRPLNAAGDGWDGSDWAPYEVVPIYAYADLTGPQSVGTLEAALNVKGTDWIVYRTQGVRRAYPRVPGKAGYVVNSGNTRFRGALPGSTDSSIFLFYDDDDQPIYREITKTAGLGTAYLPTGSMTTLASHSGSFAPFFFVMQKSGDYRLTFGYKCRAVAGELIGSFKFQVVPMTAGTYDIPHGGEVGSLQGRRNNIKNIYNNNKGASASILTYFAEAFRLVPLQLGLNMQASAHYQAALDWFLTVYDYRAPQGQRYVDYGLAIDAGLPATSVFLHPEDWLLDPLNPHAIALTRRLAQTRFVIATIVGCLNQFGDAEFITDTSESLVRARLLYTTALELCDTPELRQQLGVCADLIGALKIAPGEIVPPEVAAALGQLVEDLTVGKVGTSAAGFNFLQKMKSLVATADGWATILPELKALKAAALNEVPPPITPAGASAGRAALRAKAYSGLLTDAGIEKAARQAGRIAVAQAAAAAADVEG